MIGTPVDEHLNPEPDAVVHAIDDCVPFLKDGQLIILRSTIFPSVTKKIESHLADRGLKVDIAFCPERIAEGFALEELSSLPQVIGARDEDSFARAEELFGNLGVETIRVSPEEAELAKLFTNTWRYIKFAIANQFFVMATRVGLDYENIRHAITHNYPRAKDLPKAGFAAGPCLPTDNQKVILEPLGFKGSEVETGSINDYPWLALQIVTDILKVISLGERNMGSTVRAIRPDFVVVRKGKLQSFNPSDHLE